MTNLSSYNLLVLDEVFVSLFTMSKSNRSYFSQINNSQHIFGEGRSGGGLYDLENKNVHDCLYYKADKK